MSTRVGDALAYNRLRGIENAGIVEIESTLETWSKKSNPILATAKVRKVNDANALVIITTCFKRSAGSVAIRIAGWCATTDTLGRGWCFVPRMSDGAPARSRVRKAIRETSSARDRELQGGSRWTGRASPRRLRSSELTIPANRLSSMPSSASCRRSGTSPSTRTASVCRRSTTRRLAASCSANCCPSITKCPSTSSTS